MVCVRVFFSCYSLVCFIIIIMFFSLHSFLFFFATETQKCSSTGTEEPGKGDAVEGEGEGGSKHYARRDGAI